MRNGEDEEEGGERQEGGEVVLAGALIVCEQLFSPLVNLRERMRNQELPLPFRRLSRFNNQLAGLSSARV
jgi:hypothetical protein